MADGIKVKATQNTINTPKQSLNPAFLNKFLSPTHLLKLSFADDNNQLNREFYAELLHILGLEEVKNGAQKFIVRKKEGTRNYGSIIENTIERIEAKGELQNADVEPFDIALNLAISWINRVLFLKLLEAQIIKYNGGDKNFAFLSPEKLRDYNDLNALFFSVLAKKKTERTAALQTKFPNVPYLNSLLFEMTETEDKTICIDSLNGNVLIDLYSKSVLRDAPSKMQPLKYLLKFLDAYDFSSESSEDIREDNKSLISASVLGLIFEKINGYKDGSFFTPSFITMYMCQETIAKAIIQKFNDAKNWNCKTIADLYNKIDDITEANRIFNSVRICDPAVGSGHFLVSALNEMIKLKSELGILADKNQKLLKDYRVTIENDELIITDGDNNIFQYIPHNHERQRVQETLFHEKQTMIENCLFGVDINSNSVKICQLRLWIELLKNAYYIEGSAELETLPNIDINIKCGNSLVSRFDLRDQYAENTALQLKITKAAGRYKEQVYLYKNANDKTSKNQIKQYIDQEKAFFYQINNAKDVDFVAMNNARRELDFHTRGTFEDFQDDAWQQKAAELEQKTAELEKIYNDKVRSCFEWRFEFPEVLDDSGNFMGFDMIIGNPPYVQLQNNGGELSKLYKNCGFSTFTRTGDLYSLFYERGWQLLKHKAHLCFISSNKWMRTGYGEKTREFFAKNTNPIQLVDFAGIKVFESATVDTNILMFSKDKNRQQTRACIVKNDGIKNLSDYFRKNGQTMRFSSTAWVILSPIEQSIKAKIERVGTPLKDCDIKIYRGVLTGCNEAFIIDGKKKDELIAADPKSAEIIRPILRGRDIKRYGYDFADLWLLYVPWHFPLHKDNNIQGASQKAEKIFQEQYPAIYKHLSQHKEALSARNQAETGVRYEWYALQRWGADYMEDFYRQKIVWGEISDKSKFALDEMGIFPEATSFLMTGEKLKYLLAILNSKLAEWLFNQIGTTTGVGTIRWKKYTLEMLPIKMPTETELKDIEKQIDAIIKNGQLSDMRTLDKFICQLYALSKEETEFIENQ